MFLVISCWVNWWFMCIVICSCRFRFCSIGGVSVSLMLLLFR